MTFVKGGILNSNQLESISNRKWKKGGILSAEQLNNISGDNESILNFEPIETANYSSRPEITEVVQLIIDTMVSETSNEVAIFKSKISKNLLNKIFSYIDTEDSTLSFYFMHGLKASFPLAFFQKVDSSLTPDFPVLFRMTLKTFKIVGETDYPGGQGFPAFHVPENCIITSAGAPFTGKGGMGCIDSENNEIILIELL